MKYRITRICHADVKAYVPEVLTGLDYDDNEEKGYREKWQKLSGNENITELRAYLSTMPQSLEDAKDVIECHIKEIDNILSKHREDVVYEIDTKQINSVKICNTASNPAVSYNMESYPALT